MGLVSRIEKEDEYGSQRKEDGRYADAGRSRASSTSQLVSLDGEMVQIGDPHRRAYANSLSGRKEIQENEPEDVTQAVFAIWGDSPTIADDVGEDDTKE